MLALRMTFTLTMSKEFTITSELVVIPKFTYHDRKFMRLLVRRGHPDWYVTHLDESANKVKTC